MKKSKKKLRIKKKGIIFIIIIFIIVIFGAISTEKLLENNRLKHFNKHVVTTKKTNLYDKNNNPCGTINKDTQIELSNKNNSKYFNIKNTNYYVYYKDVKKTTKQEKVKNENYYLPLNKLIKSKKKVTLYNNKTKVITINKNLELKVDHEDENNYYLYFSNNLLSIKKNKNITEEKATIEKNTASKISVLFYDSIEPTCTNYNCTTIDNFKRQMELLKTNGYYTIFEDDYNNFLKNYINLKDKALFITTSILNDDLTNISKELNINITKTNEEVLYLSTNKASTKNDDSKTRNRYQIKSYTTDENILKMANGEEVKETTAEDNKTQKIAVLNYHFFYDSSIGESCGESICLDTQKFREHLDYLKNNNYKTLTMNEFMRWMYGEIELPEKSILITVDDGALGTGKHNGNKLIPLLEEYKMHATLFLIAGWWDINNYTSPYLDIQSHTYDMHQYGSCGRGQLNCATYEEAKADLQKSLDVIGNSDSFCFPFYMYSDTSLKAIKDTGFKIAFVGGNRKATRTSNKYLIPRYPIHASITQQDFINMVN
ncbi:MAG: polysaccharide deacetylase family protein [Bacilli bacterium]|nr:polysaccharide deacetylase family protein [Bacilli bacterium]